MTDYSENKGKVLKLKDNIEYQEGSVVSRILFKKDKHNATLFAFDKSQSLSEHTVPFDAILQVIDGQAEVVIGGNSNFLREGEMIIMPADIPHEVKAKERFKMLLTMIRVA